AHQQDVAASVQQRTPHHGAGSVRYLRQGRQPLPADVHPHLPTLGRDARLDRQVCEATRQDQRAYQPEHLRWRVPWRRCRAPQASQPPERLGLFCRSTSGIGKHSVPPKAKKVQGLTSPAPLTSEKPPRRRRSAMRRPSRKNSRRRSSTTCSWISCSSALANGGIPAAAWRSLMISTATCPPSTSAMMS